MLRTHRFFSWNHLLKLSSVKRGLSKVASRRFFAGDRGWTLVELMLVTALIGIIVPAITFLFTKVTQGMAGDEMHIQLMRLNNTTQLRLHERIASARHLFQGDSSGVDFLGPVTLGMSANTQAAYPILGGTLLAKTQPAPLNGLATFSPAAGADRNLFGNSILFAAYDSPQTLNNQAYVAPTTISGPAILYSDGVPVTLVVDLYRFYYYYLTDNNPKGMRGVSSYRLMEWQSIQYADFTQISAISDSVLQTAVITWLATPGKIDPAIPGYAIATAWDPSQVDPDLAFYDLHTDGTYTVTSPVVITESQALPLTRVTSGILSTGFGYGISPNTGSWVEAPPVRVPLYGTATGSFPGGFEVGISGTSAGRQVMTHFLLVAKGAAPRVAYNVSEMVHNIRDTW